MSKKKAKPVPRRGRPLAALSDGTAAGRLGILLRHGRLEKGLTQEQVAERIGTDPELVGRYERGGIASGAIKLIKLIGVTGITFDEVEAQV